MAKHKNSKELDRIMDKLESEWAIKRGKNLPLNLADQLQWEQESYLEMRFQQSKDLLMKSNKFHTTSKDEVIKGLPIKYFPHLIRDGVVADNVNYTFMPAKDAKKILDEINDAFNGASHKKQRSTMISLISKRQCFSGDPDDRRYGFKRAVILVSPNHKHIDHLFIHSEEEIAAFLFAGLIKESDDPINLQKRGFLEIKDMNMESRVVELEEFCALIELEEINEYIFTIFDRTKELLFSTLIPKLEDVEFEINNKKVCIITKEQKGYITDKESKYVGQTFGRLTAIKPAGITRYNAKLWLFQCSCGKTVEKVFAMVKGGYVKSCGCLIKEQNEKLKLDMKGQIFGRLTAIEETEEKDARGNILWRFKCSCGKEVMKCLANVKYGSVKSCGCLKKEMLLKRIPNIHKSLLFVEGTGVKRIASDKLSSNNTSGVKGVHWHIRSKKWCASIRFQNKSYTLGFFDKIEDAADARRKAEEKLHKPIIEKYMSKRNEVPTLQ
jgi:hypothetical protein